MRDFFTGPFGALFFGIFLRFIPLETFISHHGSVYSWVTMYADWRIFNGVLSVVHLIELILITRNRTLIWAMALNPIIIFLVSQPGDLFWLFEGVILSGILLFARHKLKAALVLFFTLALVFL